MMRQRLAAIVCSLLPLLVTLEASFSIAGLWKWSEGSKLDKKTMGNKRNQGRSPTRSGGRSQGQKNQTKTMRNKQSARINQKKRTAERMAEWLEKIKEMEQALDGWENSKGRTRTTEENDALIGC